MDPATAGKLADALVASDHIDEAVVLSTCNRTEVYASVSRFHGGLDDATTSLARARRHLRGRAPQDLRGVLRRGRRRPRVHRGLRSGFARARGEPDPRPGQAGPDRRPDGRDRRHRAQRLVPAGPPGRQAGAERDRDRPRRPLPGLGRLRPADRRDRRADRSPGPRRRCRSDGRPGRPDGRRRRRRRHLREPDVRPGPAAGRGRRRPGGAVRRPARRRSSTTEILVTCTGSPRPLPGRRPTPRLARSPGWSTWPCPPTCPRR